MGVIHVAREQHEVVLLISACICNVCGKRVEAKEPSKYMPPGIHKFEFHGNDHTSGFPAEDNTIEGAICDECLRAWVPTFKVPPEHYCTIQPRRGPMEVIHSETGQPMIFEDGWVRSPEMPPPEAWLEWEYDAPGAELFPSEGVYRHFKGKNYKVFDHAFDLETKEAMVIYLPLYGDSKPFARPAKMWADHIERDGYSGPRFTFLYLGRNR